MNVRLREALRGARLGVVVCAGLTLGRWLTWEPYEPLLLPYDALLCAGVLGLACALLPRPRLWLAAQAVLALGVNHLLFTIW